MVPTAKSDVAVRVSFAPRDAMAVARGSEAPLRDWKMSLLFGWCRSELSLGESDARK